MKSRWTLIPLCLAALLVANGLSATGKEDGGKEKEKEFEATCPVSDKPAKETSVLELKDGSKVYFCCNNCPKAYQADPKKFATKVNRQLFETGQVVQVACPMSGKPFSKDAVAEVGESDVHFCCENCVREVDDADDDKQLELAFGPEAMKKGFTRQTKCPVSGKPINPTAFVEHKGEKVYFCCPGCPKAFEENPEKFMAKLPQFAKASKAEKN